MAKSMIKKARTAAQKAASVRNLIKARAMRSKRSVVTVQRKTRGKGKLTVRTIPAAKQKAPQKISNELMNFRLK